MAFNLFFFLTENMFLLILEKGVGKERDKTERETDGDVREKH